MAQIKIPEPVVLRYLSSRYGKVRIISYEKLGSGWHGTGYKVKFKVQSSKVKSNEREIVIRTLMPRDFSHDFLADRAKVFVTQHEMSRHIPGHIISHDVSGYTKAGRLVSIGDAVEFFQVVEVARGSSYSADFQRIKRTGSATKEDIQRAGMLGEYLAKLHSKKMKASSGDIRSVRRRHLRDCIGHGEMMVGVIDTYPDGYRFVSRKEMDDLICMASVFREHVKDTPYIPCRIHGDFHPGNIMFEGSKIRLLDASREVFGDPADDVICLAMNYIWFAVMQTGRFEGPFKRLFDAFWSAYFGRTRDRYIARTAGVHMAFRAVVVAHPVFYRDQTDAVRRKMIKLTKRVLKSGKFVPSRINEHLR